jgi:hypothetical protein
VSSTQVPRPFPTDQTQVARYRAFPETAAGFTLPTSASSDRHFFFSLPGAIALPAVIYWRTRRFGKPAFSVRLNDATLTQYTFVDGDEAERTWHEIIPANTPAGPTLRSDNNELVFFARDGSVGFGDVVILYTSSQTTVPGSALPMA